MQLLTWHGTFVCLPDHSGAMRHQAPSADDGLQPLEIELPDPPGHANVRHTELGTLQTEAAQDPGAIHLLRDGLYMCADNNTGQVVFDRPSAAAWESFLPLSTQDAADLSLILRYRWIVRETRQVIHRRQIGLRDGFKLRIGPYAANLATSLATLATQRGDNGLPIALTLHHAGEDVSLVVAEPRSSALVQTEMWPPRARRIAEILTFAAHRQLTGLEPSQADFERDVKFLQDRQGAAGLEDLLENVAELRGGEAATAPGEPTESAFEAGLAAVGAYLEASQTRLAKAALEDLVARFPNESRLWLRLGEMHLEAGDYDKAQRAWERCATLDPACDTVVLELANLAAFFGKKLESISRLAGLVAATPRDHRARVFLAQRYAELDWMDLARDTLEPIAGELTDWREAIRRGMADRLDRLQLRFDALAARTGKLPPLDALAHARLAFSLGRLDTCASLLDSLPDAIADRAEAHILQADLRLRRDGVNAAIAYLEALDGPARDDEALIVALARLHVEASWNEEATAALTALVNRKPRADAWRLLCVIANAARDLALLRFASQGWLALNERDTGASQWALTEAWSDGRLMRVDDIPTAPSTPPYPVVMQFWDQAEPPIDVAQAMQTWQNRNPGLIHSVFDDQAARAFMTAHNAPEVLECYDAAHHPAMQSDIFRLAFLLVRGGIYVDADDLCVRDMRGIFAALSEVELVAVRFTDAPPYVNNGFIAARPGCKIIEDALQDAVEHVLRRKRDGELAEIWQATGPGVLTRAIVRFTADPAHRGKVMLLSESEYRNFALTQQMAYKQADKGDWRLLASTKPRAPAVPVVSLDTGLPRQAQLDDVMMGWAMREVAPWQFRPASRADADRFFDRLNETHDWISVFQFAHGQVTIKPNPNHPEGIDQLPERARRYLQFFQSVTPLLPPGFSTTICMGLHDTLPPTVDAPIFCFQKTAGRKALLLPDIDFLDHDFYVSPHLQDRLAYHEKQRGAVFAGSTTGGMITPAIARDLSTPRLRAAKYFQGSATVDFRLPNIRQCTTPDVETMLRAHPFCQKPALDWQEQLRRRMMISMDGNGATCSRVAIALHSHSVLLKYASDNVLYYFGGLQPWVHYVSITQDSDVEHVIDMEARDPDMFARIAENGRVFAQSYLTADAARRYTAMLLRMYEQAFSDGAEAVRPVAKLREMAPLPPGDKTTILAHIQGRGDRTSTLGAWVGEPGSTRAIEGFAISLPATYPAGFTYRAVMAKGVLSDIGRAGSYCGTRGENLPLYGVLISLDDEFTNKYHVEYEASFVDGSMIGPVPAGTVCVAADGAQMEAIRITMLQRKE